MNSPARPPSPALEDLAVGTPVGPFTVTVSRAANERYWRAAGAEHPLLEAGALYPPIAANLTVLTVQTVYPGALLQTAQRVVAHRRAEADVELTTTGAVTERYEKRGREYAVVTADVTLPGGELLWTSIATFTPAGT